MEKLVEREIEQRSGAACELCGATEGLVVYEVEGGGEVDALTSHIQVCGQCHEQIAAPEKLDAHHWHCLNSSIWSEVSAVKVLGWRILNRLQDEPWARDLLDMCYLDDDLMAWAQAGTGETGAEQEQIVHLDSNGTALEAGDTVLLIKDLNVKGGGFTAKRGTAVRGISLVADNAGQIEGKINGQTIVILTQFVKKA